MGALSSLLRHSLSYFFGRMAVLLAGLISLPLMTRLLPKEDYGLMSLVFLAITITTSLAALGFPQSTTRYFARYAREGQQALREFCSTMTFGGAIAGALATAMLFLASLVLLNTESFASMAVHLRYAAILVLIRIVTSVFLQIFRGNQQTMLFNAFNIATRYLTIGTIVLMLFYVRQDVTSVFLGTIYVEAAVMLFAFVFLLRRKLLGRTKPAPPQLKKAIKFGMPLVFADLMVTLVASSDRFAIQYFLGPEAVATYSVAYDISDYVAIIFASPLQLAILPIVYSLWSDEGKEATREFLNKAVNMSLVIVIAMVVGFGIVGPDVVTTLASDKYIDSGKLIPFVACGVIMGSIHFLLFTGLLLQEKTAVITALNASAAATNLVLNILFVPRFGIVGAAYATILTYAFLNTITYLVSSRYLAVRLDLVLLVKAAAAAAVMGWILVAIGDPSGIAIADIALKVLLGAFLYVGSMLAIDHRARDFVREFLDRRRSSRNDGSGA